MTETADITACVARLERLLDSRLGLARGPLAQRVAKVGRRVPLSVRRDLGQVAQAAEMVTHPKLGLRVDHAAVLAAGARAEAYLKAIDAADRRRGRLLGMLGALVFNLLLFAVLLVIVLRWRGLV
jgi:tetrahydromethanopterin S-methyltransferase subunit G